MVALPLHEKNAFDTLDDDDEPPRRPSPVRLAILLFLVLGIVRVVLLDPFGVAGWSTSLMTSEGTVTHIVMFQFRDGVNRDVMAEVRFLSPSSPGPVGATRPHLLTPRASSDCISNVCAQGRLRAPLHGGALHQQRHRQCPGRGHDGATTPFSETLCRGKC